MRPGDFAAAECINLVTCRRDGGEVATPVWFVLWNDRPCLRTATHLGKVERIRNHAAVRYAACDWHGTVSGPWLQGTAELIPADDPRAAHTARHSSPTLARTSAIWLNGYTQHWWLVARTAHPGQWADTDAAPRRHGPV